jgi:cyclic pyranopterin phosphate synthase
VTLPRPIEGLQPGTGPLLDRFGRAHTYLRVSVTDRCNLRCTYCVPDDGVDWKPRSHLLSYEEIARIAGVFVRLGIRRVRLTGGEPLLRRDLPDLVRALAALGLDDLALTTNGVLLPDLARPLADAGLRRVNVSLDAVDPAIFRRVTRGGDVARVLAGIEAARAAGLVPIKVNAVVVPGENDGHLDAILEHFAPHAADTQVRFLETMPFTKDVRRRHRASASLREQLAARWTLVPLGPGPGGPSVDWRVVETGQVVGFVSPMSEHFCDRCNRLRLEADGHLRTCLSRDDTPSLRDLLRADASDEALQAAIRGMVWGKVAGHEAHLDEGWRQFEGVMTRIGG